MRHPTFILALAVLSFAPCTLAQTGFPPFASIERAAFDARNDQNMNVNFALPIVSSPSRGLNLNLAIAYNSLTWVPKNIAGTMTWTVATQGNFGWQINSPIGGTTYQYSSTRTRCGFIDGVATYTYVYTYSNYIYVDPNGTQHTFSIYQQETVNNCTQSDTFQGTYTGYANDLSGLFASIAVDPTNPVITTKSGIAITNTKQTDTNGNYISSSSPSGETDWTDSTGRLALKIVGGAPSIQYKFYDPTGAYQTTTLNFQTFNIKTNFGCSGIVEYNNTAVLPVSLVLPNNQTFRFTYEPTPGFSGYYTGRVQRVTLPTGGYYEYDYTGANDGINCADGTTLSMNRVVSDGTNTATWNFVRNTSNLTTTITTPRLADTPNANDTVITFNSSGQETSRKIYANSPGSGTPLRTINTTWAANGTPATQVTILDDGSTQSEVATTYDSHGLLDSVSEYAFGTGSPGSIFRTTTYTYQTSTNYTNLNILDLVTSKQIKDGGGNVQYRQDIAYDATSGDNQNCPAGVPQHTDNIFSCTFYYRGNPTSVTTYTSPSVPSGGITKNFTYDWFGNLLTAQVNCCQNKTWAYSSTTNYSLPDSVTSGSSPSLTTNFTYNSYTGQVATSTDPNSLVTNLSYDTLRRPTQIFQKYNGTNVGGTVSYSYDDTHFTTTTTSTIDASKSVQQITALDTLGRPNLTTTEDVGNNIYSKLSVGYDFAGRAYQTSNPYTGASPSYWTTTAFDALGRPTSVTLPDNSATTYSYSTNTATVTDPAGKQRKSLSDAGGRLVTVYEPDPSNNNTLTLQTSSTYNVLDELTQVTQGSQTRTFAYDALGRILSATTPESNRVCFGSVTGSTCNTDGYDSFDNLQKRTDARGVLTSYGYDSLNRLTSVSYTTAGTTASTTSSLGFTYGIDSSCNAAHGAGCIGQLITMTDGVGSENYTYNNLEQLTQLQKVISGSTYTTSYAYNLAAELTQITYPSGRTVQQSVDAIGRLCEVAASTTGCGTAASPFATGYSYNAAGLPTGFKYGNNLYASFGFSLDRLQLNCLDYSTTNRNGTCAHDGTTKFGLNYSFPAAPGNDGLISGITDSSGTQEAGRSVSYTYDSLYRLSTAVTTGSSGYPQWGLSETYDRYGNRNTQATIQGQGCTSITCPTFSGTASTSTNQLPSPYTYDSGGNMTNDGNNTLVYDAENHPVSATNGSSAGAYAYDGNGLRVQKCLPSCGGSNPNTVYIFSGSKVVAEYDNGAAVSAPSREYIYSGATLLAKIDSSGTNYYHHDHLSNRLITDSSGNTVGQQGHFPFGEQWYPAPPASPPTKWEFTTYERDSESGNDYAQARYNVNRLGRFSSPDAISGNIADPQSLNRYSYVRNMPVMLTDPSGLCVTAQNQDRSAPQESTGAGGPSLPNAESDMLGPEPQQGQLGCPPPSDGSVSLDGGDITAGPGQPGSPPGGDLAEMIGVALAPTEFMPWGFWGEENGDPWYEEVSIPIYGNLGLLPLVPEVPDPQRPGDPNARKKKYIVKLNVLNDCLSKMGIKTTIDSLTPSTPGGYGTAKGNGVDWFSGHGNTVPITVTNDAHTYNAAQITAIVNQGRTAVGFTDPHSPYTNYTNNNNTAYGTVDTQVWELGNSLWHIQAGSPLIPSPTGDKEPGNVLEKCVRAGHGIQAQ